mgnify:CR=1 FL=1
MKTTSFLLTVFTLLLVLPSCDNSRRERETQHDLIGFWTLESITGGLIGTGHAADFTDLEFKSNGTYRLNNHDEAKGEGRYTLSTVDGEIILRFSPNNAENIGFEVQNKTVRLSQDTLILSDPCCDLFEYRFSRDGP